MSSSEVHDSGNAALARFERALDQLAQSREFAKGLHSAKVLQQAARLLREPDGPARLLERAADLEAAGVFAGTDWAHPEILQADLTVNTLRLGHADDITLECLSELRLLAVARGLPHPALSAEQAHHYLAQVLALNLDLLFDLGGEAIRIRQGRLAPAVRGVLQLLVEHIGYDNILDRLIEEIWRILAQRPVRLDHIKAMITQIAACLYNPSIDVSGSRGADRLVSALFGPTQACSEDPGLPLYQERLAAMDGPSLAQEANGFARAMHDTGLVSPYHTLFLRFALDQSADLVSTALGLSATGRDGLLCYQELVYALIDAAVHPETAQTVYGLALLLERGTLFAPPMAPALWRQLNLELCPEAEAAILRAQGEAVPARVRLLADVLGVLGLPLGIGQGNNPTCQSARALSMWAHNDPDYLLQMIVWAARDDDLVMHFEGQRLSSKELSVANAAPLDVDAVSALLVPHLDRIYHAMGALCADRGDDPHRWINPEFHGWWVGRGFKLAVDLASGALRDYEGFVRHFHACYHPLHNGNQPLIHPQPAGLAVTDSAARFVGWHAITIQRVALDQEEIMRVYFYNPNNDSGQDLGNGVKVSTEGRGERFGESSLPVAEFVSRLYIFHFDPLEHLEPARVPARDVAEVEALARGSWARDR
ncbi:hypothetical protein Y5W_02614 [Alcanivorax sp. 521-1]|uniref:Uncharacterized protein n=1 Tax=Alloalcanivorax profundimaris TaxID=2735259 RepID=A0ABS0AT63_9GAMM|nr:hypothetical protein [Alloalcanivorax profundimaris]MBF5057320.1 hypothetical protein [Alloalcanivorax profundimaris]MBM1145386.1 hypothetical protein [Alcanivorax sp. ZXX171]MBU58337.1 hypothetical protein [Alcanivorax sp.]UWN49787.1 hypothetical protein ASALC70_02002 [Alcanivorax sp. ALC70]